MDLHEKLKKNNPKREFSKPLNVLDLKSMFLRRENINVDNFHTDPEPSPHDDNDLSPEIPELPFGIFPYKMRYLDLTILDLKSKPRVPTLMLIRSDWDSIMDSIGHDVEGRDDSVVITGQPGIGSSHYFLSFFLSQYSRRQNLLSLLCPRPSPHSITAHCVSRQFWNRLHY